MIRRTAIAYAALTFVASLVLGTHLAHAQELGATTHAVAQSAGLRLTPETIAISTELGQLKARRLGIDFTGPHWLVGLGVAGTIATAGFLVVAALQAAIEGAFNLVTGSSSHSTNVPAEIALGTALGSVAAYVASAAWCFALNVERGQIDSRIRDLSVMVGVTPMEHGLGASATFKW